MTYDFTVWTPSWTDWLAAISITSISTLASSACWRALLIQKRVFVVRFQLISSQEKLHSHIWILCYVNNGFGTLYLLLWIRPTSALIEHHIYCKPITLFFQHFLHSHILGMAILLWSENTNSCAPIAMAYLNTLSVETTRISSRLHPLYFIQLPSPRLNCNLEAKSPSANRPTRSSLVNRVLRDCPAHNTCSLGSLRLHCGLTVVAVVEVVLGGLDSFGFGCFVQFPLGTHLKWQQLRVTSYVAWENSRHLAT